MGYNAIAYALNDMHIPARKGEWGQTSVVNILTNEVYLGKIRWWRGLVKKAVKDGFLAKPTTQHILDNYDSLTIAEKNRLWKLVMPKATVYRSADNELTVNIYPNLPK